jgi:hypothetical protein
VRICNGSVYGGLTAVGPPQHMFKLNREDLVGIGCDRTVAITQHQMDVQTPHKRWHGGKCTWADALLPTPA